MPATLTLCFSVNFNLTLVLLNLSLENNFKLTQTIKNYVRFLLLDQQKKGIFENFKSFISFHPKILVFDLSNYKIIRALDLENSSRNSKRLDQNFQRFKIGYQILLKVAIAHFKDLSQNLKRLNTKKYLCFREK
ncbi:conserved hypothetical protein [Planktothrix serta PCC 8927]|uniref:Uncharacterized protein n=1 Tax=Planktothrix serta PCC 8927 TaxID=671068 RepID=A0A7Z9E1J4_9CYAN|nr:hypothetical protein [Planktothrix serta]VXD21197.1 conserved hypothetical protein [Planktothrix serta PCC 8927]